MNTIIVQTDKVTFLIVSQNSYVSIARKKGDVDFQSHPQLFSNEKPSAEQGIYPRSSGTVVFCAIGCASSTSMEEVVRLREVEEEKWCQRQ